MSGKIKAISLIVMMMTVALLGWAMRRKIFNKKPAPGPQTVAPKLKADEKIVYDAALLKKFNTVCQSFNVQKEPVTYSGVINITNGVDTTQNVKDMGFLYVRNGNDCYVKWGQTETLNRQGVYLYIEHEHKRIIISSQKAVPALPLGDFSKIADKLQSEHYVMSDAVTGPYESISLVNEHHISCKEYKLTFDTLNYKVKNIYVRLSFFSDPLNKKKEKIINMNIASFERVANLDNYNKDNIVTKVNGEWKLKPPYADYKLITIP